MNSVNMLKTRTSPDLVYSSIHSGTVSVGSLIKVFKISNASAVFQALVNNTYYSLFVFVYLDDILIFSKEQYCEHVRLVCISMCQGRKVCFHTVALYEQQM